MSDNKVLLRTEDGKKVYILSGSDKKELILVDETIRPPKVDHFDLVPPGKMDNIDARIDDLTSQNASLTNQIVQTDLISLFTEPILSSELFTIPTGVNEFDLLYVDGYYHLFYDDKSQVKHRQANSLAGLSETEDDLSLEGRYPSVLHENGLWHLWVWNQDGNVTKHYTCSTVNGIYVYSDDCIANKGDWKVSKNPVDNKYYASYKDAATKYAGIAVSSDMAGEWTDLGYVFSERGRTHWHQSEEADSKLVFKNRKCYMLFAGSEGATQRIGMVEISTSNYKALNSEMILVNPEESWHQRNSRSTIFSPIYLDTDGLQRIFYSQNPGDAVTAGWGYISPAEQSSNGRRKTDLVRIDFSKRRNISLNVPINTHGSPEIGANGMKTSASPSGAYGSLASSELYDFTMQIEFTVDTLQDTGVRLFTASLIGAAGNVIGIWLLNNYLYIETRNAALTNDVTQVTETAVEATKRYKVSLRRYGNELALYVNGVSAYSATHSGVISNLQEFRLANQKGFTVAADQQFLGTIHSALLVAEALPTSMV